VEVNTEVGLLFITYSEENKINTVHLKVSLKLQNIITCSEERKISQLETSEHYYLLGTKQNQYSALESQLEIS
jgi:hypothetical protein